MYLLFHLIIRELITQISIFGGTAWKWNEKREQFYYHQFAERQPDLNLRNPILKAEIKVRSDIEYTIETSHYFFQKYKRKIRRKVTEFNIIICNKTEFKMKIINQKYFQLRNYSPKIFPLCNNSNIQSDSNLALFLVKFQIGKVIFISLII